MLIVRSPVRISFGGGGTDLPAYYEQFGGAVVSAAINKYFYTFLGKRSDDRIQVISSDLRVFETWIGLIAAVERLLALLPGHVGVEVRTRDQAEHLDALVDGFLGRAGTTLGSRRSSDALTLPCLRSPVFDMIDVRLSHLGRVADRHRLADHPAHRHPDDVGPARCRGSRAAPRRRPPCH